MPFYVGLDVSKATTSVCVLSADGLVVSEGSVGSTPCEIAEFLRGEGRRYVRVGMESCGMSAWLYSGLARARLPIVCIEARHAHGVLKARTNKTDKNDARGIAEIMRVGIYKSVHVKSAESRRTRAMLLARKTLCNKRIDLENLVQGLVLENGLKPRRRSRSRYVADVKSLVLTRAKLAEVVDPLLVAIGTIGAQINLYDAQLAAMAQEDPVCRRLMTAPGVGPLTALYFRSGVDEPGRFARSRDVGPHFGLAPRIRQSGTYESRGHISKFGDVEVRRALYIAATSLLRFNKRPCYLQDWGRQIAERRGQMPAVIAVARRLAVTLHRMWVTETDFEWQAPFGSKADRPQAAGRQDPNVRMAVEETPQVDRESGLALPPAPQAMSMG